MNALGAAWIWFRCNLLGVHRFAPDGWLPNGRTVYRCCHCIALDVGERGAHRA